MGRSTTIEIGNIGPVLFERSKRAKHLIITVKPYRGVRVAVPYGITFEKAEEIVREKITWIQKHLAGMKQIENEHKAALNNITEIDRAEAKEKLINKLNELAEKHDFVYNKIFIRNQKTRWGSCSSRNNISLNMKLVLLPDELIEYVILHELTHIRIRNHKNVFWAELNKLVGDAKALSSRLKEYQMLI